MLKDAELSFPRNCETPIAANLTLIDTQGTPVDIDLDFLQTGVQTWDIVVETDAGRLTLSMGGTRMAVDNQPVELSPHAEYSDLYAHFAELVHGRRIDVDLAPLQLVGDAFLCGRRRDVDSFTD